MSNKVSELALEINHKILLAAQQDLLAADTLFELKLGRYKFIVITRNRIAINLLVYDFTHRYWKVKKAFYTRFHNGQ